MKYSLQIISCLLTLVSITPASARANDGQQEARGLEIFEQHIRPTLVDKCYSCHSKDADSIEGGLELDTPAGMARGGESGPLVEPDQVESSLLLRVLRHEEDVAAMPPEEKLSSETIEAFAQWLRLGAPDPRDESVATAQELAFEERLRHWAFQPPVAVEPPAVKRTDWSRGPIDAFVLARLESEELQPVGDASRATLVRRLYFDLIGLPPKPAEVRAFVEDQSSGALPRLVDRLLASARFGERWARHWLDVVRFAESSGKEFNFTYPHAWPYREYVIAAFNNNKPYDLFVREQLAGDLMAEAPYETPEDREARLVAASMLSFGAKRHNSGGMTFRMEVVDDQIDVTCRAILGVTVACAKCHDHKFDPIPTKDYYALAGIFLSTEPLYGTIKQIYSNSPTELVPLGRDGAAKHEALMAHEKMVAAVEKPVNEKKAELTKAEAAQKEAEEKKVAAEKLIAEKAEPAQDAPPPQQTLDEAVKALAAATAQISQLKAEIAPLQAAVEELKKKRPPAPRYAMSARDRAAPTDSKIAIRGDIGNPGEVAPRGFLTALPVDDVPGIDTQTSGRLELADWIVSPQNPLPARVMVNRIWHHLFGRGLVESVDNFGLMGDPPSHPALLDTLAVQFMEDGWSVKRMIRSIVLSRTYQLSTADNQANSQLDPENRLLWRSSPRRLSVEAIRDAVLAVSGQLQLDPPVGSTVTGLGDQMVRGVDVNKLQPPNNHRSVYLPIIRDYMPDMFDRFDFPSAALVSGKRAVTNVPAQALFLRNSKFIVDQANHAAKRLLADQQAVDDSARVDLAARWTLGRGVTDDEREELLTLIEPIQKSADEIKDRDVAAWATLFQALFATAEFRYLVDINTP